MSVTFPVCHDYDPEHSERRGFGWMCDDKRPTLTLTEPSRGVSKRLELILIGMFDYYSGLDEASLEVEVVADFKIDRVPAGENLAGHFAQKSPGVWELRFAQPIDALASGTLWIRVKDRQGNQAEIVRTISVKGD